MCSRKFLFCVVISSSCFLVSVSQSGNDVGTNRSDSNKSSYIYRDVEEYHTTVGTNGLEDICGIPQSNDPTDGRNKRSAQTLPTDITMTTESPTETTTFDFSILSESFKNCTHIAIEPECYVKLQNGSAYVPNYNKIFQRSDYIIMNDLLVVCPDFYDEFGDEDKFPESIEIVCIVCLAISEICITLHKIMFIFVEKLRNLPGYCLFSLCVSLSSAYICSFIQYAVSDREDCTVIGLFLLYFFLASFFWMNTMSYDVWRSIRLATAKLRLTSDRPIMVRFGRYSAYSWGMPLLIIICAHIIHYTSDNVKYKLIFNVHTCWFVYRQALTLYFASPLFILLGLNIIFFISSFCMILRASMSNSERGSQNGSELSSRLFLSLRLSSVMGLMWIFGILAAATDVLWLWYLYAVCNALQGVFIFFSFTVSERSRKACLNAAKGRKFSTFKTQSSSQPVTSA